MLYADHNGTSPLSTEVKSYLIERIDHGIFANPNAIHSLGQKVLGAIEKSRKICAEQLGAKPHQIFFNSGSSEGISQVFHNTLYPFLKSEEPKRIAISAIEHSAVVNAANSYQDFGFIVDTIPVNQNGVTDTQAFTDYLKEFGGQQGQVKMVSVMAANNETGVIQPYAEISQLCKQYSNNENPICFFSDTTQYIGKTPFHFEHSQLDYAVISGHKVGALIGAGILLVNNPYQKSQKPIVYGGGQENGWRGGTQNYLAIETLAVAFQNLTQTIQCYKKLNEQRITFEEKIKKEFPQIIIMGEFAPRLPNTTMLSYPGVHGQGVQIELESQDIFVTTSSACSDNEPSTSKVLKAMGVNDEIGRGAVRISLSCQNTQECYSQIYDALKNAYHKLAKIKSY